MVQPSGIFSKEELLVWTAKGGKPKYLFFWGHRPPKNGQVGASCFSQWYAVGFTLDGVVYPTAEHFMMAEKARLFADEDACRKILQAKDPAQVKAAGRAIKHFDEAKWQQHRFQIVVAGNRAKFSQNQDLGEFLLGTGDKILVEASPVDAIWGIGLAAEHEHAGQPQRWPGLNLLGFALMQVRAEMLAAA